MSHNLLSIVCVYGCEKEALREFVICSRSRTAHLDGTRISKRWKSPLIDELRFEYLSDVRCREQWPNHVSLAPSVLLYELPQSRPLPCAYYAFYSRGLGGGLDEYFLDASLRFPRVRFVVQWLYADFGELGVRELQAGEILGEELYDFRHCGERFFREVAAEYFGIEFSQTWFEGMVSSLNDRLVSMADEAERLKAVCTATSWSELRKAVGSRMTRLMAVKRDEEKQLDLAEMKRVIAVEHIIPALCSLSEE